MSDEVIVDGIGQHVAGTGDRQNDAIGIVDIEPGELHLQPWQCLRVERYRGAPCLGPLRREGKIASVEIHRRGIGCVTRPRSEEHTSELQSLMRTSYAVFCLKK